MTTTENMQALNKSYRLGIYLFEMTTTENNIPHQNDPLWGIYLLGMATTENTRYSMIANPIILAETKTFKAKK